MAIAHERCQAGNHLFTSVDSNPGPTHVHVDMSAIAAAGGAEASGSSTSWWPFGGSEQATKVRSKPHLRAYQCGPLL